MRIAETKVKRRELTGEIVLSVVLPQVLLILFACVIVWVGVVKGLSPLASLQQAIAARSYRDRSPVRVSQVPGEVRPLMDAINQLLERLDNALTMQDRFTADAARRIKEQSFDLGALRDRGYAYERLDQLTMELLLGAR